MAETEAERRYLDEAREALGGLVVAGYGAVGGLQRVEELLDEVSLLVNGASTATRSLRLLCVEITCTTLRASMVLRMSSAS
jgi:hypothetical protein